MNDATPLPQELARARADLLQEMKVTKGCRFNASRRLERRDRRMNTITAFASVYVILLTVLPLFFHFGESISSVVTATVIVFSLVILASSLLQYSNNDPVRAEQHHRCGLEVNALRREFRAISTYTAATVSEYGKRFDELLQKYGTNHDDIDFDKYKVEHPSEYPSSATDDKTKALEKQVDRTLFSTKIVVGGMSVIFVLITALAANLFMEVRHIGTILFRLTH
jgi:SMODS and SLOG-associating 2TM effector domain family 5